MLRVLIDGLWILGAVAAIGALAILILFIIVGLAAYFGVEPD